MSEFTQDPEGEAEALLDMDGRRERLEEVVADLQSGKVQPVDHATAAARLRQSTAYLIGKDGGTFKFTITDVPPDIAARRALSRRQSVNEEAESAVAANPCTHCGHGSESHCFHAHAGGEACCDQCPYGVCPAS